jgi:hypothetical protein
MRAKPGPVQEQNADESGVRRRSPDAALHETTSRRVTPSPPLSQCVLQRLPTQRADASDICTSEVRGNPEEPALHLTSTPPFLVVHFDQGWHYKMQPYRAMLARRGLKQSMSRKGNCFDNAANDGSFGPLVRVVSPGGGAMQAFWPLRREAVTVAARSQHADRGRASACHSHGSAQPFASGSKTRPTSPMRGLGFCIMSAGAQLFEP